MKKFIIGIAGAKNSGKDTVASMINYIFAVGVTRASYAEYLIKRTSIDNTYKDRIAKISTLFNQGGKKRFTPADAQHLVLLSDFASASKVYLESDTIHNDNVQLTGYETVPYWQGSGTDYGFTSKPTCNNQL